MNKQVLKLAIPNILSNISVPLLTSVDTALMGHQVGATAFLAALGLGGAIFNLVYWNFSFLRMGTTGIVAQAVGRKDWDESILILLRGFLQAFVFAIFLLLFQQPLVEIGMLVANTPDASKDLVLEYFNTRIWAAPATLSLYVLMGWFFGAQNSIYPLIITVTLNAVNIFANLFFVNTMDLGLQGVALGTVIAQYLGLVIGLYFWWYKYGEKYKPTDWAAIFNIEALKSLWKLNKDIFIRTFALLFVFTFFYNKSANLGIEILAVNQVLLQLFFWMAYAVDGFGFAAESLVGKYAGAKNITKLKKAIRLSFIWGMAFSVLIVLIYAIGGQHWLQLFTDDVEIIELATEYWLWIVFFPLIGAPPFIWDGIFVGLTASAAMRNTMLIATLAFVLTWYSTQSWGNHGVWLALSVFMIARNIAQTAWYYRNDLRI